MEQASQSVNECGPPSPPVVVVCAEIQGLPMGGVDTDLELIVPMMLTSDTASKFLCVVFLFNNNIIISPNVFR